MMRNKQFIPIFYAQKTLLCLEIKFFLVNCLNTLMLEVYCVNLGIKNHHKKNQTDTICSF